MSRKLDDLAPHFKPIAFEFLARCVEFGYAVLIVDTRRTPEEQAMNIQNGVSWTRNSKHLIGEAIDVCPYEQYSLYGADKLRWDASDEVWLKLGHIGEACGMVWGGRWRVRDLGHFEYKHPVSIDNGQKRA